MIKLEIWMKYGDEARAYVPHEKEYESGYVESK